MAQFSSRSKPTHADGKLVVVRVDPKHTRLALLSLGARREVPPPDGLKWAQAQSPLAVTNAGMFELDGRTNGYSRSGGKPLNPVWHRGYRAVLVADPVDPDLPAVQILDGECDDVKALLPKYRVALQSIRMVSCNGRNTWQRDHKRWSVVIAALDGEGRLLFIHSRSPFQMQDFINEVLALPLGVQRAIYLEGGPEATLVAKQPDGRWMLRVGSYETGFNENDLNDHPWALPNVLAIFPK